MDSLTVSMGEERMSRKKQKSLYYEMKEAGKDSIDKSRKKSKSRDAPSNVPRGRESCRGRRSKRKISCDRAKDSTTPTFSESWKARKGNESQEFLLNRTSFATTDSLASREEDVRDPEENRYPQENRDPGEKKTAENAPTLSSAQLFKGRGRLSAQYSQDTQLTDLKQESQDDLNAAADAVSSNKPAKLTSIINAASFSVKVNNISSQANSKQDDNDSQDCLITSPVKPGLGSPFHYVSYMIERVSERRKKTTSSITFRSRGMVTNACLWHACRTVTLGTLLIIAGITLAVLGYLADQKEYLEYLELSRKNSSYTNPKYKEGRFHLNNMSFAGPVVMGVGGFLIVAACVMTFEARDNAGKVVPASSGNHNHSEARQNINSNTSINKKNRFMSSASQTTFIDRDILAVLTESSNISRRTSCHLSQSSNVKKMSASSTLLPLTSGSSTIPELSGSTRQALTQAFINREEGSYIHKCPSAPCIPSLSLQEVRSVVVESINNNQFNNEQRIASNQFRLLTPTLYRSQMARARQTLSMDCGEETQTRKGYLLTSRQDDSLDLELGASASGVTGKKLSQNSSRQNSSRRHSDSSESSLRLDLHVVGSGPVTLLVRDESRSAKSYEPRDVAPLSPISPFLTRKVRSASPCGGSCCPKGAVKQVSWGSASSVIPSPNNTMGNNEDTEWWLSQSWKQTCLRVPPPPGILRTSPTPPLPDPPSIIEEATLPASPDQVQTNQNVPKNGSEAGSMISESSFQVNQVSDSCVIQIDDVQSDMGYSDIHGSDHPSEPANEIENIDKDIDPKETTGYICNIPIQGLENSTDGKGFESFKVHIKVSNDARDLIGNQGKDVSDNTLVQEILSEIIESSLDNSISNASNSNKGDIIDDQTHIVRYIDQPANHEPKTETPGIQTSDMTTDAQISEIIPPPDFIQIADEIILRPPAGLAEGPADLPQDEQAGQLMQQKLHSLSDAAQTLDASELTLALQQLTHMQQLNPDEGKVEFELQGPVGQLPLSCDITCEELNGALDHLPPPPDQFDEDNSIIDVANLPPPPELYQNKTSELSPLDSSKISGDSPDVFPECPSFHEDLSSSQSNPSDRRSMHKDLSDKPCVRDEHLQEQSDLDDLPDYPSPQEELQDSPSVPEDLPDLPSVQDDVLDIPSIQDDSSYSELSSDMPFMYQRLNEDFDKGNWGRRIDEEYTRVEPGASRHFPTLRFRSDTILEVDCDDFEDDLTKDNSETSNNKVDQGDLNKDNRIDTEAVQTAVKEICVKDNESSMQDNAHNPAKVSENSPESRDTRQAHSSGEISDNPVSQFKDIHLQLVGEEEDETTGSCSFTNVSWISTANMDTQLSPAAQRSQIVSEYSLMSKPVLSDADELMKNSDRKDKHLSLDSCLVALRPLAQRRQTSRRGPLVRQSKLDTETHPDLTRRRHSVVPSSVGWKIKHRRTQSY